MHKVAMHKAYRLRQLGLIPLFMLGLLSTLATGGGSGEDGGGPTNTAPQISNLQLSADSVDFMMGGGTTTIQAQIDYTDPEADVESVRIEVSDGSTLTIPVPPPLPGTSGTLVADVEFSTDTSGVFTAEVWVIDRAGNSSNRLSTTMTILGGTELTGLSLSAGQLDQAFEPGLNNYTAVVDFTMESTTVTATLADPSATFSVNGTAATSDVPTDPINLDVGQNLITVTINAEPGGLTRTYTVMVTRLASALLSDLSLSVGEFDQIFQPELTDYTTTVRFLIATTTITPSTEDPAATVTVNGVALPTGTTSEPFSLAEGINVITVAVTAADGATTSTYLVDVTRQTVENFAQQAYVKASNTDPVGDFPTGDLFGYSVALSGDTLVVSAIEEESGATGIDGDQSNNTVMYAGAVYVFTRDVAGVWSQQAYIKASNTDSDDFGWSVAIAGDTLAVGAVGEDSGATGIDGDQSDNNARDSGAVYVFTRDAAGIWSQQAYIKASNTDADDGFGGAVALSDNTLIVGASGEDSAATGIDGDQSDNSARFSGAVYVYQRDQNGKWAQQAYLKASNAGPSDTFGKAVSLDGNTLVVGAPTESSAATGANGDQSDNSALAAGAAYVFARDSNNVWSQQAYIKASNTEERDQFGRSVAIVNNTIAVGATGEDSVTSGVNGDQSNNEASGAGAVYLFAKDGEGLWFQQAYVKASNTTPGFLPPEEELEAKFGRSVALFEGTLAVGAPGEFGSATGINGDQSNNNSPLAGAVYLFTRDAAGSWSQQAYVKASNTDQPETLTYQGDWFGYSISISGDTLAVGARGEDSAATGIDGDQSDNSFDFAGATYVFQ